MIKIEIGGRVKTFVLLNPAHIELTGKAGEAITSKMTLTPAEPEMDFKIAQAKAKENQNIRFDIKRNDQATPSHYELVVENIKKDPGFYSDVITIWTDSTRKIYIRVFGNITQ